MIIVFTESQQSRCDRAGLAGTIRLAAVRCPSSLAFDIERQTCNWKPDVNNCDRLSRELMTNSSRYRLYRHKITLYISYSLVRYSVKSVIGTVFSWSHLLIQCSADATKNLLVKAAIVSIFFLFLPRAVCNQYLL